MKGTAINTILRKSRMLFKATLLMALVITPGLIGPLAVSAINNTSEIYRVSTPNIPVAPGTLSATAVSPTQVNLTWVDSSNNETGFKIDRANDAAFSQNLQTFNVGANIATYNDTSVAASSTYSYRVVAYDATGNSPASNTVTVTTPAAQQQTTPTAPVGLTATSASATQVNLTWTDSSNNETGFKVDRANDAAFSQNLQTFNVGVNITTYNDTSVVASTAYSYRVIAFNTTGNSAASNTATVTTPTAQPATPPAPTGLTAVAVSANQINLTWADNSNNETGFKIETATGPNFLDTMTILLQANATAYSDTSVFGDVSPGATFYYRIYAFNAVGNSSVSNTVSATIVLSAGVPAPPSNLRANVSGSQVDLAWNNNSTNESGFLIERAVDAGFNADVAGFLTGADVVTYTDTIVVNTTYYYRVKATNVLGNSEPSNVVTIAVSSGGTTGNTGTTGGTGTTGSGGGSTATTNPNPNPTPTPTQAPAVAALPQQTVNSLAGYMDNSGYITDRFAAMSDDGNAIVFLNPGVRGTSSTGQALSQITIFRAPSTPTPDTHSIGPVYNFGPDGAKFDLPVIISITYDPAKVPAGVNESSLYLAVWEGNKWVRLESGASTPNRTVSALVQHFSNFSVLYPDTSKPVTSPAPSKPASVPAPAPKASPSLSPAPAPSKLAPVTSPAPDNASSEVSAPKVKTVMAVEHTPSRLTAVPGTKTVELAWNDNALNEQGYDIERSMDGSNWITIDTISSMVQTGTYKDKGLYGKGFWQKLWAFFFGGLERETTYYYRVRAFNELSESQNSNVVFITTR